MKCFKTLFLDVSRLGMIVLDRYVFSTSYNVEKSWQTFQNSGLRKLCSIEIFLVCLPFLFRKTAEFIPTISWFAILQKANTNIKKKLERA